MWINGKITLKSVLSVRELVDFFPASEAKLDGEKIVIETQNLPFFAEHKLHITIHNQLLTYKLWVPSLGPLILFMYMAVVFLAGFTNWKMFVVGSIVVTGIAFAIYVLNDKGARHYLRKYIDKIIYPEELVVEHASGQESQCPACQSKINAYTSKCPECGLHLRNAKKIKTKSNHTAGKNIRVNYYIKK